jgi:hypothetical protein
MQNGKKSTTRQEDYLPYEIVVFRRRRRHTIDEIFIDIDTWFAEKSITSSDKINDKINAGTNGYAKVRAIYENGREMDVIVAEIFD